MNQKVRSFKETTQPPAEEVLIDQVKVEVKEETQEEVTTQPPVKEVVEKLVTTKTPHEPKKKEPTIEEDGFQLSVFENLCKWVEEQGSVHEKHVLTVMQNYVAVGLTSVNLNDIAVEQQRFWRLFEYIHNQPTEFQKLFGLIIAFAKEYKSTIFSLSVLFRAQSGLNLSVDQLVAFNNLRTLVLNTVQTKELSKVKTLVDIRKIVEHDSIPEHIRGMYVGYYN